MNIKTLTGPSIHETLIEARRRFGDDVVLLESTAAEGTSPARITVMTPRQATETAPAPTPAPAQPIGYGYRAARPAAPAGEEAARPREAFSRPAASATPAAPRPFAPAPPTPPRTETPGRGRLFAPTTPAAPAAAPVPDWTPITSLFDTHMATLQSRLDLIEQRIGATALGASAEWAVSPAYTRLLAEGMRPSTLARLFDQLARNGYTAQTDAEELRWATAQELRQLLGSAQPRRLVGTQLFIGPSGAGKTALLLKLARHPNFLGRRGATVIVIRPEREDHLAYQDPVDLYRRFDLPVQSVSTLEEMHHALSRTHGFDHVLIDTPSMPARAGAAHRFLMRIRRLTESIVPLQVQFVVNATSVLDGFDADFFERMPMEPSALALTHLDETPGWGRVAEWLLARKLPVQFISAGAAVPDSVGGFSAAWFVEKLMDLREKRPPTQAQPEPRRPAQPPTQAQPQRAQPHQAPPQRAQPQRAQPYQAPPQRTRPVQTHRVVEAAPRQTAATYRAPARQHAAPQPAARPQPAAYQQRAVHHQPAVYQQPAGHHQTVTHPHDPQGDLVFTPGMH